MDQSARKEAVAAAAAERIASELTADTVLGIGTGSTANRFIDLLAAHRTRFAGAVASSEATAERLRQHGIDLFELNDVGRIRFYVDGADEVDANLNLIKGGGGALTREKIVANAADCFICIVDDSKLVASLGAFPLPLEVLPMAREGVLRALRELGGEPTVRRDFTTDNGNIIIDTRGLDLSDPQAMERRLNDLVGVLCNGLFALRPADELLVAGADGAVEHRRGT